MERLTTDKIFKVRQQPKTQETGTMIENTIPKHVISISNEPPPLGPCNGGQFVCRSNALSKRYSQTPSIEPRGQKSIDKREICPNFANKAPESGSRVTWTATQSNAIYEWNFKIEIKFRKMTQSDGSRRPLLNRADSGSHYRKCVEFAEVAARWRRRALGPGWRRGHQIDKETGEGSGANIISNFFSVNKRRECLFGWRKLTICNEMN